MFNAHGVFSVAYSIILLHDLGISVYGDGYDGFGIEVAFLAHGYISFNHHRVPMLYPAIARALR